MLTIVNRYILKEILLPFALSLLVFTFTLISGNLLKLSNLIINNGIGILVVIKIFLYFIPYLLAYTLPMAFLSAITITFGKFSQDNEITALRASGISVFTIINPILILALGLSFFSIFINNPLMARSHYKMRVALMEMGYKTPEALIKPGRFINTFNRYNFYIKEIDNKILKQVIIYENMDKNRVRTITAQEGYIELSENKNRLILHLKNGTANQPDPNNPQKFYKMQFKSFPIILELDRSNAEHTRKYKRLKEMNLGEISNKIKILKEKGLSASKLLTEFHRKISFSFAGFVFALIGAPLAIKMRRGDKSASIGVTLILTTVYYLLYTVGKTLAHNESIAPLIAMWMPNLLIGSLGIYFLWRLQKV